MKWRYLLIIIPLLYFVSATYAGLGPVAIMEIESNPPFVVGEPITFTNAGSYPGLENGWQFGDGCRAVIHQSGSVEEGFYCKIRPDPACQSEGKTVNHTYSTPGTYEVTLIALQGCSAALSKKTIDVGGIGAGKSTSSSLIPIINMLLE